MSALAADPGAPPRLLMVLQDLPFFISHRLSIARAARAKGWDVHVAAPADPRHEPALKAAGLVFHPLPMKRGGRNPLAELNLVKAMAGLMTGLAPDVVHLVSIKPVLYGGLIARVARLPAAVFAITGLGFLFTDGSAATRALRPLVMAAYRFALHHPNARAIFQNRDDLALFEGHRLVRKGDVVMIKGCGVDLVEFHPPLHRKPAPPVVLFPARLLGDKGLYEFVDAARRLRAEGAKARFVVVGRHDPDNPTDVGPERMAGWIAAGLIEHPGFSTNMAETFRMADIACLPSYREGMPRSLMEAAASGLPVVTTDVPGCREAVLPGETGILVPVRDGAALAKALRPLIEDAMLRRRMGEAARRLAEAEFSVEEFVKRSLGAYEAVLALPGRRRRRG
jgi:glycosyltransferase involved in cell wall biosynthesis